LEQLLTELLLSVLLAAASISGSRNLVLLFVNPYITSETDGSPGKEAENTKAVKTFHLLKVLIAKGLLFSVLGMMFFLRAKLRLHVILFLYILLLTVFAVFQLNAPGKRK
jgi:hypothetical protein